MTIEFETPGREGAETNPFGWTGWSIGHDLRPPTGKPRAALLSGNSCDIDPRSHLPEPPCPDEVIPMPPANRPIRPARRIVLASLAAAWLGSFGAGRGAVAEDAPSPKAYLEFIRERAKALRGQDRPPTTRDEWRDRAEAVRRGLGEAWGAFPAEPCPLDARVLGTLDRDGYRVEKVDFQTFPGVRMTANAYVPAVAGKRPAILAVHGHWRGAKQDPVVQARCIGAAKLGFFVLAVDAFGAGERGVGEALGEYHGDMTAATLLPVGLPLSGLQVYENLRAVDYLRTRPEVDAERIGITGASGGGNQTMYAGAWDARLKAAVPVCSVGNYQAYLGVGCCMCEVVPGALRFAEEWAVLGMVAPRGLLVVNATRDAPQFSVAEAEKTLALAGPVFGLYDRRENLRHTTFESGHDYSRPMREAMYGWMARNLQGEGDGSPIAEPATRAEDPEALRCYPGDSRPDDWATIPRFASAEGRKILAARPEPTDAAGLKATSEALRTTLVEKVFGGFPDAPAVEPRIQEAGDGRSRIVRFRPEPGIDLTARVEAGRAPSAPLAILIDLEGAEKAASGPLAAEIRRVGWGLATLDLRATGKLAWPSDKVNRAPDHNTAEWGLWIGRPMLGQWVLDVRRLLDALERADGAKPGEVVLIGDGPGGLVALAAAAVDPRIARVAAVGTLASYLSDGPYVGQRLGVMAPGIVRDVGDVAHLASLAAPRRVVIAGGVAGDGRPIAAEQLRWSYRAASRAWGLLDAGREFSLLEVKDPAGVVEALR
jgi:cephalosporin-C deacetylase-like acetyl esterase